MKNILTTLSLAILLLSSTVKSQSLVKSVYKHNTPFYTDLFPVSNSKGVYVATSAHLLALREFNDTGLVDEYVLEVDEINNLDSYYDPIRNQIWRDYLRVDETGNVITSETPRRYNVYQIDGKEIRLVKTEQTFGEFQEYYVYGVRDGVAYLSPRYGSTSVVIYDTDNKVELNEFQEQGVDRATHALSVDGSYLISLLRDGEMTVTTFDKNTLNRKTLSVPEIKRYQFLRFVDQDTFVAWYGDSIAIYSLNDQRNAIAQEYSSTAELLKEQFSINEYNSFGFNETNHIAKFSSNNSDTYLRLSKVNDRWQMNRLEPISDEVYEYYSVTFENKIIASLAKYELIDGVWTGSSEEYDGINHVYDNFAVTNLDDSEDLYLLTQSDKLHLSKLVLDDSNEYTLSRVSSFPIQSKSISNAVKVNKLLYVTNTRNQLIEIDIDTHEFRLNQLEPSEGHLGNRLKALIKGDNIFFYGFQLTMCDMRSLECTDKKPTPSHNKITVINENFVTMTIEDERRFVRLNIESPDEWYDIDVSGLPEDVRFTRLEPVGNSLTANNGRYFLSFDENWSLTLSAPDILNSDREYVNLPEKFVFDNGSVSCDNRLGRCAAVNGNLTLYFETYDTVSDTSLWYFPESAGNQNYVFNDNSSYYELFKVETDVTFPKPIKSFVEYETNIYLQNTNVEFNFNDHLSGIEQYSSTNSNLSNFEGFMPDENGILAPKLLTNEQTWQESALPIKGYNGTNEFFSVSLEPIYLQLKDVNDAPEFIEGASLTYSIVKGQRLQIMLNSIYQDPERKPLKYSNDKELPSWLNLTFNATALTGIPSKYGVYQIPLTVSESYSDEDESILSSKFTVTINVTNEEGIVPSNSGSLHFILVFIAIMACWRRNIVR